MNHKLVAKVMANLGLAGLPRKRTRKRNLIGVRTSSDLVNRNFTADQPNQLWVTDITEHSTKEGTLYACVVLDVFSRKAVGWAVDRRPETSLVNSALFMAYSSRQPAAGGIIHADHGAQFTSWAFTSNVDKYGLRLSLGTVGDCFDNAMIESFWARMQTELLDRKKWVSIVELSTEMVDYIDTFHNHKRRHSSLDMRGLTRFCGHSRLVVSSCSNHDVVVELFEVGGADHSEAGVPPLGVIPTLNPLKHGRGELNPAGPGLPVE